MKETTDPAGSNASDSRDESQERHCLRCRSAFWSEWYGERICPRCKNTTAWRGAVAGSYGQGRRQGGGRSG